MGCEIPHARCSSCAALTEGVRKSFVVVDESNTLGGEEEEDAEEVQEAATMQRTAMPSTQASAALAQPLLQVWRCAVHAETQTTPREMKDVRSQAPCTYTSVRGSNHPRFYPLPPHSHG